MPISTRKSHEPPQQPPFARSLGVLGSPNPFRASWRAMGMKATRTNRVRSQRFLVFTPWLTVLAVGTLCHGCGAPQPTTWPGTSDTTESSPPAAEPQRAAATERQRAFAPGFLDGLVAATDQPQISQGHQPPNYLVQVLVSPESVQAYRTWSRDSTLPHGTWLVARHTPNPQSASAEAKPPLYLMYRSPQGWRFGAATAEGWWLPIADGVCHDCHTQAPAESVFGVARKP